MLYEFISVNREEIIRRCSGKVATRSVPPPTDAEIEHGVPVTDVDGLPPTRYSVGTIPGRTLNRAARSQNSNGSRRAHVH